MLFCLLDYKYLKISFLYNGEEFCHHNTRNWSETNTSNSWQLLFLFSRHLFPLSSLTTPFFSKEFHLPHSNCGGLLYLSRLGSWTNRRRHPSLHTVVSPKQWAYDTREDTGSSSWCLELKQDSICLLVVKWRRWKLGATRRHGSRFREKFIWQRFLGSL